MKTNEEILQQNGLGCVDDATAHFMNNAMHDARIEEVNKMIENRSIIPGDPSLDFLIEWRNKLMKLAVVALFFLASCSSSKPVVKPPTVTPARSYLFGYVTNDGDTVKVKNFIIR